MHFLAASGAAHPLCRLPVARHAKLAYTKRFSCQAPYAHCLVPRSTVPNCQVTSIVHLNYHFSVFFLLLLTVLLTNSCSFLSTGRRRLEMLILRKQTDLQNPDEHHQHSSRVNDSFCHHRNSKIQITLFVFLLLSTLCNLAGESFLNILVRRFMGIQ